MKDFSPFDLLPDAIVVVDRGGIVHYANPQVTALFGTGLDRIVGQPVEILLPAYLRSRHALHRRAYAGNPHLRPMGAGLELMGQRADGSTFPVDIMLNPVEGPGGGERGAMVIAVIRDVSERRAAGEALRQSRQMFEMLFECAPDAIIVVDDSGAIERVNAQGEALFGLPRARMIGLKVETLMPAAMRERHVGHRARYGRDSARRPMGGGLDLFAVRGDGTTVPVDIMLSPLELGGRRSVLAVIRDITERRRESRRMDQLLKEVNHRAKNMLGVVQAIARQTAFSDPELFRRFADRIQALSLSQDLLIGADWDKVDLRTVVLRQIRLIDPEASARVSAEGPPLFILPDAVQPLGMAMHELAANARRVGALGAAGGSIAVDWRLDGAPGETRFAIAWRERAARAPAPAAAAVPGYGTTILTTMMRMSFGGDAVLEHRHGEVEWRLSCPAANMVAA